MTESRPRTRDNPIQGQESYLESKGWTFLYYNQAGVSVWEDPVPKSAKSELKPAVVLPVAGGGTEVVMQWHGPPAAWRYQLPEAVIVQRSRDEESIEDQIKRLEDNLVELKRADAKRAGE